VLNIRLTAIGRTPNDRIDLASTVDPNAEVIVTEREIWSLTEHRMVMAPVYQGGTLGPGATVSGPAIIELGTTTIVVHDEYDCVVDVNGSFVMYLRDRAAEILPRLTIDA
jgi:N-methylhydantoinase A